MGWSQVDRAWKSTLRQAYKQAVMQDGCDELSQEDPHLVMLSCSERQQESGCTARGGTGALRHLLISFKQGLPWVVVMW